MKLIVYMSSSRSAVQIEFVIASLRSLGEM